MPKGIQAHPAERLDLDDFTAATRTFTSDAVAQAVEHVVLDHQSRIRRGFRIELPSQTTYPGRIVVHGGDAYEVDGTKLHNEDQLNVSRTITLEGASTTFYVEIQFTEGDGDVDARGFWDPTVDQGSDVSGDALPDGQEFSDNVATTKVPDWKIVTPISTSAFARDSDPSSTKIPLIRLTTDGSNRINSTGTPGLTTEKPATTILEVVSTTVLRVQDAQMFPGSSDVIVGDGATGEENAVISTSVPSTNLITLTAPLSNSHAPGEILRGRLATSLDLITEVDYGRYRRPNATNAIDWKDKLFQGDEVHGDILSEGHDTTPDDQSSDINLQALKDHVDFLSAQFQEMKWGHRNPYVDDDDASRAPPGVVNDIPTTPRYFHKSGGIQGARTATVTVGDGTNSWGDFIGADETGIQAALDSLPAAGGTVVIRDGTYTLANDVTITGSVKIIGNRGTIISTAGGAFDVQTSAAGRVRLHQLAFIRSSSDTGVEVTTTTPAFLEMRDCFFQDTSFDVAVDLPDETFISQCTFKSVAALSARALVRTTAAGADIHGVWDKCLFQANQQTTLAATCVDASGSTLGLVDVVFRDCEFESVAASNAAAVDCGSAPSNVNFTRCKFTATLLLTAGHIWFDSGDNLSVIDCINNDIVTRVVDANLSTEIIVDGVLQLSGSGSPWPIMRAVDCSNVTARNCRIQMSATVSTTQNAFRFESQSSPVRGIIVSENTIEGLTNYCTGIIFDCSAGTEDFFDVQIIDNNFMNMEVGIFFRAGVGARQYYGVNVEGNIFNDRNVSATVASYQKICITAGANAQLYHASFVNNKFININPGNTNTVGGRTRAALDIQSATNEDITIAGNHVVNVGNSSFALANTAAFRVAAMTRGTIVDNIIDGVDGNHGNGMILSESTNAAVNLTIKGNVLRNINTTSAGTKVWGITAANMTSCTFVGNVFEQLSMAGTAASPFGCIGHDNASGVFDEITVVGNSASLGDADVSFVAAVSAANVRRVSVTNNIVDGTGSTGVYLSVTTGGALTEISVSGNSIYNVAGGVYMANGGTTGSRWTITGNSIYFTTGTGIYVSGGDHISIAGNLAYTTGTTKPVWSDGCTEISIIGNVLRNQGTAAAHYMIDMSSTSDNYIITNNILDDNNNNTPIPIYDGNATAVGIIVNNVIDSTLNASTASAAVVSSTTVYNSISGTGLYGINM